MAVKDIELTFHHIHSSHLSLFYSSFRKQWFDQHHQMEVDQMASQSPIHHYHLDSLCQKSSRFSQVEFIPNVDLQCFFAKTTENQLALARKSRITKTEEIEHAMNFFPRMQFLLTNRSMKMPNLRSICFEDVKIDGDDLTQLHQVMDNESSTRNNLVRCVENRIFIL